MKNDPIAAGTITGLFATIPQLLFNLISFKYGFAKFLDFQISGSVYLNMDLTYTFWGLVFGALTWCSIAVGLGIILFYLVKKTGSDYWWLKGILVSNLFMFTLIYGFFSRSGRLKLFLGIWRPIGRYFVIT